MILQSRQRSIQTLAEHNLNHQYQHSSKHPAPAPAAAPARAPATTARHGGGSERIYRGRSAASRGVAFFAVSFAVSRAPTVVKNEVVQLGPGNKLLVRCWTASG
jgi:hypothetical protein